MAVWSILALLLISETYHAVSFFLLATFKRVKAAFSVRFCDFLGWSCQAPSLTYMITHLWINSENWTEGMGFPSSLSLIQVTLDQTDPRANTYRGRVSTLSPLITLSTCRITAPTPYYPRLSVSNYWKNKIVHIEVSLIHSSAHSKNFLHFEMDFWKNKDN